METIRILIADDHKLIREAWANMFNADPKFIVVATCGDSEQAVALALEHKPDIILMDINMPPTSGIDATTKICSQLPETKVIGVSLHSQPSYAKKIMNVGAKGYITKNSSSDEMMSAIYDVHQGKKYICDEVKTMLINQSTSHSQLSPDINKLSYREMQITDYIRKGFSSKEIAAHLDISFRTVEVHRHNIFRKLGITNSVSLINLFNSTQPYSG